MIHVKQIKGWAKLTDRHTETLRGLGLGRTGSEKTLKNTPAIMGMVKKVSHLITWEEVKDAPKSKDVKTSKERK